MRNGLYWKEVRQIFYWTEASLLALHANSELTDGQYVCGYKDVPVFFANIEKQLQLVGIEPEDILALECENTLLHALALLYFVNHRGNVFVFTKRRTSVAKRSSQIPPPFCRYRVSVANTERSSSSPDPEDIGGRDLPLLRIDENPAWFRSREPTPVCLYLPTSGSSGYYKIAAHEPERLRGNVANCVDRFRLEATDRVVIPVPIGHMYGLAAAFLPAIAAGASIDLQCDANLPSFLRREEQFRPNVTFLTPAFCEVLLRFKPRLGPFRLTVTAGDKMNPESFIRYEELFGFTVNLYGTTEMGAVATSTLGDPVEQRSRTVGQLMPGVRICNRQAGLDPVHAERRVQELCVQHDCGFQSYVDYQGRVLDSFESQSGNCYCTRDLVRIWPSGQIEILGRTDNCFNRDGMLVAGEDIEKALRQIEGVKVVAVVARGTTPRGKGIFAFYVLNEDCALSPSDIRKRGRDLLASYARPDEVFAVDFLPVLDSGKVDRQQLLRILDAEISPD